ncbi:MAG: ribosome small subunit-dependent GTPase A [Clostridiales bacterium]|nr:ribosome small subunit-dependent GTPase A [Clostridiales bacterium]
MEQGIIIKGVGGFYDVLTDNGIFRCKARGIFRKKGISPMVGDEVEISVSDGAIVTILPRKNQLIRPVAANIDILGIVVAAIKPEPDYYLADKLMIMAESMNIRVLLIINKIDLVDEEYVKEIAGIYQPAKYPIVPLSCKERIGFEALKEQIGDNIVILAGQSGVGKSSIINELNPEKLLDTGGLSAGIDRGRHTTRHTQLLVLPAGGMMVDTPGFSNMNIEELEPEELSCLYPDFMDYMHNCRFNRCMHDQEPGCGIKHAVAEGLISKERYERYIRLLGELLESRKDMW